MKNKQLIKALTALLCFFAFKSNAQELTKKELAGRLNTITTPVSFLLISPDSRAGAMGDCGVATSPDIYSMFWNPSKLAMVDKKAGFGLTMVPWLKALLPGIYYTQMNGYGTIGENSKIGGALTYFALGEIQLRDNLGNSMGQFNPKDFSLSVTYATKLSENFSIGTSFRFINSNLAATSSGASTIKPGRTGAGDVGIFYHKDLEKDNNAYLNIGASISNIGGKITYTNRENRSFLPANLKFGAAYGWDLDQYNKISITADINKLLVPTTPYYLKSVENTGDDSIFDGSRIVQYGKDPNVSTIGGMVQSFYDAPGGLNEEVKEYMFSGGVEYNYDDQFFVRAGGSYESNQKGGRQYLTAGIGLKMKVVTLDASYLIPVSKQHPLANTLRFSLTFDVAAFSDNEAESTK